MTTVPGDPASTSVLGGALRRHALTLLRAHDQLEDACLRATRRGAADLAPRERELLTSTAEQLDRVGALLQAWATDTAESSARVREIAAEATRSDLSVDGHHVIEAAGPSRAEPAARLATRERLQQLLNRVTAQDAKARGRVQRELEASGAVLARTSERARLARD